MFDIVFQFYCFIFSRPSIFIWLLILVCIFYISLCVKKINLVYSEITFVLFWILLVEFDKSFS